MMIYPKHMNAAAYCKTLKDKYSLIFNSLSGEIIKNSIGYVINRITELIEENKGETLKKVIGFLFNIKKLLKEELVAVSGEIQPIGSLVVLYGAMQKPLETMHLIENN